ARRKAWLLSGRLRRSAPALERASRPDRDTLVVAGPSHLPNHERPRRARGVAGVPPKIRRFVAESSSVEVASATIVLLLVRFSVRGRRRSRARTAPQSANARAR